MKCIVLLVLLVIVYSEKIDTDVRLVHVFFRHGTRYPGNTEFYPTDPYIDHFPKRLHTLLTERGKNGSYGLGQLLKARYNKLIGQTYDSEVIRTTSTATNRTVMTAQLVLSGLFQKSLDEMLQENFDWDSLPYKIEQDALDIFIFFNNFDCKAYEVEFQRFKGSSDYDEIMIKYNELFNYLSYHTRKDIKNFNTANELYQLFNAHNSFNLPLPIWAQTIYPEKLHEASARLYQIHNYNNAMQRLNGGKLIGIMAENIIDYITNKENKPRPKMYLYSGHDSTIASLLAVIGLFEPHAPKYNSALIFELHQLNDTKQHLIKTFYLKGTDLELEELFVKGCTGICKLEEFVRVMEPRMVKDHEAACNAYYV